MNTPSVIEYKEIRVITTEQLAQAYETDINNIKNNFNNNKDRFVEGTHYYFLQGEDLKDFKSLVNDIDQPINKFTPQLYLWTERGASRHCKILDTSKAWEQFDYLEDTYFRIKQQTPTNFIESLEALVKSEKEKLLLIQQLEEQAPKVELAEAITRSSTSISVGDMAKILKQNGIKIGRNNFFVWLRENSYLMKDGRSYNKPTQHSMDLKIMEYEERVIETPKGEKIEITPPLVTGKGQQYFVKKFLAEKTKEFKHKQIKLAISIF